MMKGIGMFQLGNDPEASECRDEQTYSIIGAAMAVHRELGNGFLEMVYQCALEKEFKIQGIPFQRESEIPVHYRGEIISRYRVDFLCFDEVLVELKAIQNLTNTEECQVINYLKASGLKRGLLINFGAPSLQFKRIVFNLSEPT